MNTPMHSSFYPLYVYIKPSQALGMHMWICGKPTSAYSQVAFGIIIELGEYGLRD